MHCIADAPSHHSCILFPQIKASYCCTFNLPALLISGCSTELHHGPLHTVDANSRCPLGMHATWVLQQCFAKYLTQGSDHVFGPMCNGPVPRWCHRVLVFAQAHSLYQTVIAFSDWWVETRSQMTNMQRSYDALGSTSILNCWFLYRYGSTLAYGIIIKHGLWNMLLLLFISCLSWAKANA